MIAWARRTRVLLVLQVGEFAYIFHITFFLFFIFLSRFFFPHLFTRLWFLDLSFSSVNKLWWRNMQSSILIFSRHQSQPSLSYLFLSFTVDLIKKEKKRKKSGDAFRLIYPYHLSSPSAEICTFLPIIIFFSFLSSLIDLIKKNNNNNWWHIWPH